MRALLERPRARSSGTPVDLEFASDGARPLPAPVPPAELRRGGRAAPHPARPAGRAGRSSPPGATSRTAVSTNITHVVYVDPDRLRRARRAASDLSEVGRAVGQLNQLLPEAPVRPDRARAAGAAAATSGSASTSPTPTSTTRRCWSRSRARRATTCPISRSAPISSRISWRPSIRYLPLYPDEPGSVFNAASSGAHRTSSPSSCRSSRISPTAVRVIDVARGSGGMVLEVLMNGDLERGGGVSRASGAGLADDMAAAEAEPVRRGTTGAGGFSSPSAWRRVSTPSDSGSKPSTSSAAPRTRPPVRRATSISSCISPAPNGARLFENLLEHVMRKVAFLRFLDAELNFRRFALSPCPEPRLTTSKLSPA